MFVARRTHVFVHNVTVKICGMRLFIVRDLLYYELMGVDD